MSLSLADEIAKLYKLHSEGILTSEEFTAAKMRLITPTAVVTPLSPATLQVTDTDQDRRQLMNNNMSVTEGTNVHTTSVNNSTCTTTNDHVGYFNLSHYALPNKAYNHLHVIISNILKDKESDKLRRLRLLNKVLSQELFISGRVGSADSGGSVDHRTNDRGDKTMMTISPAEAFLCTVCGFKRMYMHTGDCTLISIEEYRNMPPGDREHGEFVLFLPYESVSLECLRSALQEVDILRQRDSEESEKRVTSGDGHQICHPVNVMSQIKIDIRKEKCRKAAELGELESYLTSMFIQPDEFASCASDELRSCIEAIILMIKIQENVLKGPSSLPTDTDTSKCTSTTPSKNKQYRRLPLSSVRVADLLLRQRGALEVLVEVGHWVLRGSYKALAYNANIDSTLANREVALQPLVTMWESLGGQVLSSSTSSSSQLQVSQPPPSGSLLTLEDLFLPDHVSRETVEYTLQFLNGVLMPATKTALESVEKEERDYARQQVMKDIISDRQIRQRKRINEENNKRIQSQSVADDNDGQKRVSIKEVFRHLMGTDM